MKAPKLYGPGDAAKFLNVSRQYFALIVERGLIPYQEISLGKVFLDSDLIRFKNQRITKAKTDKRVKLKK